MKFKPNQYLYLSAVLLIVIPYTLALIMIPEFREFMSRPVNEYLAAFLLPFAFGFIFGLAIRK